MNDKVIDISQRPEEPYQGNRAWLRQAFTSQIPRIIMPAGAIIIFCLTGPDILSVRANFFSSHSSGNSSTITNTTIHNHFTSPRPPGSSPAPLYHACGETVLPVFSPYKLAEDTAHLDDKQFQEHAKEHLIGRMFCIEGPLSQRNIHGNPVFHMAGFRVLMVPEESQREAIQALPLGGTVPIKGKLKTMIRAQKFVSFTNAAIAGDEEALQ